jgi:hypothetical protein
MFAIERRHSLDKVEKWLTSNVLHEEFKFFVEVIKLSPKKQVTVVSVVVLWPALQLIQKLAVFLHLLLQELTNLLQTLILHF